MKSLHNTISVFYHSFVIIISIIGTPALVEVLYDFGTVYLSVCSQHKISELAHQFFLVLLHEVILL